MSALEVHRDPTSATRAIVAQARAAVEQDHAEVICLGCGGMAGLEEAVMAQVGVPVIDGVGAAVRLCEVLVAMGLKTSKVSTYAYPQRKEYTGWPLSLALGMHAEGSDTPT